MLKYLSIFTTTAIVNLVLVATNTIQIADAAIVSPLATVSNTQGQLIAKGKRPAHVNAQQQSDVQSIHNTLTQFYRGLNEYSVEKMAGVAIVGSSHETAYLRSVFNRLKSARVEMSVEVRNIELVSMSEHNALVKIDQVMKVQGPRGAGTSSQSSSLALIKERGQWKVSDGNTVMKSVSRDR